MKKSGNLGKADIILLIITILVGIYAIFLTPVF